VDLNFLVFRLLRANHYLYGIFLFPLVMSILVFYWLIGRPFSLPLKQDLISV